MQGKKSKTDQLFCIVLFIMIMSSGLASAQTDKADIQQVRTFISQNWVGTIESNPNDKGNLIGLPHPYNVPTVHGEQMFKEMYYWDIFFTNLGLLHDNQVLQAQHNVDNVMYMVNRFGKMLNGSNICYLNRSQPPYLSMMVADIFSVTKNKCWLKTAVATLEKEYKFWMTERMTPCGLNRYSSAANDDEKRWMADLLRSRFNKPNLLKGLTDQQILTMGSHFTAEAESGWDFNPRFESRCEDFCPVDLNSNLYLYETNFAKFYTLLGNKTKAKQWTAVAKKRKTLVDKFCWDKTLHCFYDYDFVNRKKSTVVSAANFSVLFAKIASKNQAQGIVENLLKLETPFGVRACEHKNYELTYQWGDANAWAPLHYLAVVGLGNYKQDTIATRIKDKYIRLVCENFKKTGNLWEKYNVTDGSVNTQNEYKMPAFLGWTAGVFVNLTE